MDAEQTIAEIERLERIFAVPTPDHLAQVTLLQRTGGMIGC